MNIKAASEQPIEELRQFQQQVTNLLKSYQGNRLVDAESKAYQDRLEALLNQLNATLKKGSVDKLAVNRFDALTDAAEKTYGEMKDSHADDIRFQKQFIKTFGDEPLTGSLASVIAKEFSQSLSQFQQTLAQAIKPISKNAADTAIFELTGPFGALAKQAVDLSAVSDFFKRRKAAKEAEQSARIDRYQSAQGGLDNTIKGIFAGGATTVPDTGSYYIHRGERVVAPQQNQDLSEFLSKVNQPASYKSPTNQGPGMVNPHMEMKQQDDTNEYLKAIDENVKKAARLLDVEVADGYFDPIIDHQDRLFIVEQKDKYLFNKRLFKNLETIQFGIFDNSGSMYNAFIDLSLKWKKFMRHPFFYSFAGLFSHLSEKMHDVMKFLFGETKSEEEKLRESVDSIYTLLAQGKGRDKDYGKEEVGLMHRILSAPGRWLTSAIKWPFAKMRKSIFGETKKEKEERRLHRQQTFGMAVYDKLAVGYLKKIYRHLQTSGFGPGHAMFGSSTRTETKELKQLKEIHKYNRKLYHAFTTSMLFKGIGEFLGDLWMGFKSILNVGKEWLTDALGFLGGWFSTKIPALLSDGFGLVKSLIGKLGGFFMETVFPLLGKGLSAIGAVLENPATWGAAAALAIGYAIGSAIWKAIEQTKLGDFIINFMGKAAEMVGLGAEPNVTANTVAQYKNDPRFSAAVAQQRRFNPSASDADINAMAAQSLQSQDQLMDKATKVPAGTSAPIVPTMQPPAVAETQQAAGPSMVPSFANTNGQNADAIQQLSDTVNKLSETVAAQNKKSDKGGSTTQYIKPSVDELGTYLTAYGR